MEIYQHSVSPSIAHRKPLSFLYRKSLLAHTVEMFLILVRKLAAHIRSEAGREYTAFNCFSETSSTRSGFPEHNSKGLYDRVQLTFALILPSYIESPKDVQL